MVHRIYTNPNSWRCVVRTERHKENNMLFALNTDTVLSAQYEQVRWAIRKAG